MMNAYQTALNKKEIQLDWDENDISAQLHEYINDDPLRIELRIATNVESHIFQNVVKNKGFASKFPRIDFRFTTFSINCEWKYFFEAKNLKQSDSSLKRRYIETGISNFTSGKYFNGSLIGYLLEGTVKETIDGINSLLKKDLRTSEIINPVSNPLHHAYYESNHKDIGSLRHLMFDFTSQLNTE
jgi:hypothetical protein